MGNNIFVLSLELSCSRKFVILIDPLKVSTYVQKNHYKARGYILNDP